MPSPETPVTRPPGQRETQRRGTIAAVAVGVLFTAIIAWFVVRGGAKATPAAPIDAAPVPDRPAGAESQVPGGAPIPGGPVEGIHLALTDKDDPRRQAGELLLASMDPLEGRHFAVERPEAWIFLRDGRTAYIKADTGKLYMPSQEPESGTISGNVVARLYEARDDGKRIDPAVDRPMQTFTTDSVAFNLTLGEISTADRFTFTSDQADCLGTGLKVVFNQVRERLELLRIEQGERIIVKRDAGGQRTEPAPEPAKPAAARAAAPATAPAPARPAPPTPVETLYQAVFNDKVVVVQDQSTVKADTLRSWVRTLDGKLPADALTPIKFVAAEAGDASAAGTPSAPAAPAPDAAPAPATASAKPTQAAQPEGSAGLDADLVLTWSGPCTITPLETVPAELKGDHVALRFTSEHSGLVELSDASRGARGRAASIDYGATSRRLSLAGPGPASVLLELPASGESLEAVRLDLNLGTGVGHISGPGVLAKSRGSGTERDQVSWTEQADFAFGTRGGAIVQAIKQATCSGDVRFMSSAGDLRGGFARADFASLPGIGSTLVRVILEDRVVGASEQSGRLSADKIDVEFKPGPRGGDPEPTVLTAQGNVVGENEGSRLTSDFLEARFGRPEGVEKSKLEVTAARAKGAVVFTNRPENVSASADEMIADLGWETGPTTRKQLVDLLGERVVISRADQSTITGTQMRLDGVRRSLRVSGAGTFEHFEEGRSRAASPSLAANWTGGMIFDDSADLVDCFGEVASTSWPEPLVRDRIDADRVIITLAPREPHPAAAEMAPSRKEGQRPVRTAKALGSVLERAGGTNARVESIRFAAAGGDRQDQVYYIEGPSILADNAAGTLDVPHAGRMVLSDRREGEKPGRAGDGPLSGDARGDSLFDWEGSMRMDRSAGSIDMMRNVRLTHRALTDSTITNLVCEHLSAAFRSGRGGSMGDPGSGPTGLVRAVAEGAVYAASGPQAAGGRAFRPLRELIADHVVYDAAKGLLEAAAAEGNQVTAFDGRSGTPQSAAFLTWDLRTDRITIGRPQTVTQPLVNPR